MDNGGQIILPTFGIPFVPQGHSFPVPSLPDDTPWEYPVAMTLDSAADFATVLLNRGMLVEGDWNGRLISSVTEGLTRWANGTMGGYGLEYLDLALVYTDDITQLYFQHEEWMEAVGQGDHPDGDCDQYGAFAFETTLCEMCEVGAVVKVLNELHADAGYTVVRVLQFALTEFFPFTPQTCSEILENYYEEWAEPEDENPGGLPVRGYDDDSGYPSKEEFKQQLPEKFYDGDYSVGTLVECLDKTDDPKLVRLLRDAIALHHLAEDADEAAFLVNGYHVFGHAKYSWESHVPPVAIFNEMNGVEEEIFDDFRNGLTQGEHTYLCFLHAFNMANANSINRGALALEWVTKLLVLSDSVLQGMNWDETRDHRFDTRVRTHAEKVKEYNDRADRHQERPPAP